MSFHLVPVLSWMRARDGEPLPDNLVIRVSSPMINQPPLKGLPDGVLTSTVHRGADAEAFEYACPALTTGGKCAECRACWDRNVPNVSYQYHHYGATAETDLPRKVWLSMKEHEAERHYGKDKWLLVPEEMGTEAPFESMQGEENVLTNPVFDYAFERVLELHVPTSEIALLSLCTARKGFTSTKWKRFRNEFPDVDLFVCSNGGIVPVGWWQGVDEQHGACFPYASYDANRENSKWDALYAEKLYERLIRLFTKFSYKFVVASFLPTKKRCIEPVHKALGELREQGRLEYSVQPIWYIYELLQDRLSAAARSGRGAMYQAECEPEVLGVLRSQIDVWKNQ